MVMREKMKDGSTRLVSGLTLSDIMLALHPVNEIYFSIDNVNPGTKFGGTWVAWGSGRVPVGVDTGQTEFDTVEETGGSKTHTLTIAEMPSHQHPGTVRVTSGGTAAAAPDNGGQSLTQGPTGGRFDHYVSMTLPLQGGGGAHNNLQPYITCYMWKRTA